MTTKAEQKKELDLIMKNVMLTKSLRNMRIEKDLQNTEFELAKQDYFKPVISKIDNVENRMVTFNTDIENKINAGNNALNDIHDLQIVTGQYLRERDQNLNDTLNQHQQDLAYQNRLQLYQGLPDSTINAIENNEIRVGPIALKYLKGMQNQSYGLHYNDTKQQYFLGNDERWLVKFNYNNIILQDVMDEKTEDEIVMTDGLWKLLTRNEIDVEEDDEIMYQELAYDYGLMFKSNGAQRNSRSKKWTHILSKSPHLQPKDVVLQKTKFSSTEETGGKERINSDPGGASSSAASTADALHPKGASGSARGIPIITAKKTATRLVKRRNTIASPLSSNSRKKLREEQDRIINEHAQNIEGDVFRTPDATLDQSQMEISYGKGLNKIGRSPHEPKANNSSNYIVLPDNNKFLIDRYKTYLSNLFLGHKLDYNEANFVAERLLKKKLLNKKQYTYFLNKLRP